MNVFCIICLSIFSPDLPVKRKRKRLCSKSCADISRVTTVHMNMKRAFCRFCCCGFIKYALSDRLNGQVFCSWTCYRSLLKTKRPLNLSRTCTICLTEFKVKKGTCSTICCAECRRIYRRLWGIKWRSSKEAEAQALDRFLTGGTSLKLKDFPAPMIEAVRAYKQLKRSVRRMYVGAN